VSKKIDEKSLLDAYVRDLSLFTENRPLTSIFFGGGTPSLMSATFLSRLMEKIYAHFKTAENIEISMEANPNSLTREKMAAFKESGINRLSIGVQSLNDKDLQFLGRSHNKKQAIVAIEDAKFLFKNVSADFIYARPGQTPGDWEKELEDILSLDLSHYSLYQLTIEEGTPFYSKNLKMPTEEESVLLYEMTENRLSCTHPSYEISNYAKPGYECRHNLTYWSGHDYIGIGPGAHGRIGRTETSGAKNVLKWALEGLSFSKLTPAQRDLEKLIMGLRLTRGIPAGKISAEKIKKAESYGWITYDGEHIRPTKAGRLVLNQLILLLSD
jgi:oxygen-independent coproporphyrinogen-3 oxidase